MNAQGKLVLIKSIHTLVWLFFNAVIFYMLFAAITNRLDWRLWACFGLVIMEGMVLLLFRFFCPLTLLARRYSDSTKDNFDIWLPNWLAKYTKVIYTSIAVLCMLIVLVRFVSRNG